jgi:cystathionine beta-lyase
MIDGDPARLSGRGRGMSASPFDRIDEGRLRSGWGAKWGMVAADEIAAWVADMDFGVPPAVRQRIIECAEREDFGYPYWPGEDPVVDAFEDRMRTRYGWQPEPGRTRVFSDLLQVLQVVVEHATAVGDGVAIHVPAYPPFLASIARAKRRIVPIPMRYHPTGWGFDADGLADRLRAAGCRLLVLVNPQNPTGRVFHSDELRALAGVAEDLDLLVLADEIHADLTYPDHRHVPFASLDAGTAGRTVTATSATKAFNIAAVRCAVAHVGPPALRASLDAVPPDYFGTPSLLGRVATVAAWRESEPWLADLMGVLAGNRDRVSEWLGRYFPASRYHAPEGTYLAWFSPPSPAAHIRQAGKVVLSDGADFSDGTDVDSAAFVRLNFATSPDMLEAILGRIQRTCS